MDKKYGQESEHSDLMLLARTLPLNEGNKKMDGLSVFC